MFFFSSAALICGEIMKYSAAKLVLPRMKLEIRFFLMQKSRFP
jgi:hypothetical protein